MVMALVRPADARRQVAFFVPIAMLVIPMALVTSVVIASFAGIVAIEYQHGIKAVHEALVMTMN